MNLLLVLEIILGVAFGMIVYSLTVYLFYRPIVKNLTKKAIKIGNEIEEEIEEDL